MKHTDQIVSVIKPVPENDGVDHINIDFNAKTKLGCALCHFTASRFTHPEYGPFNSMEGFWYWLLSRDRPDILRSLSDNAARAEGRKLIVSKPKNFREEIFIANYHKVNQNLGIKKALLQSSLPFESYYLFGKNRLVIKNKTSSWLVEDFEKLRRHFVDKLPAPTK